MAEAEFNANTTCVAVKTGMKAFCTSVAANLHLPWDAVISDINKAVLEGYLLANIHVVRLLQTGVEPGAAVMTGVPTSKTGPELRQSIALYNEWRDVRVGRSNNQFISSGWQQNAARQVVTNAENAVSGNFFRRFTT